MEIGITDLLIHKLSASLNVSRPLDPNKLQCLETDLTGMSPRTRWIQNPIETISYDFRIINHQTFKAFLDKHSYFRPGKGTAMQCQCNVKFCLVHQSHPRSHSSCHWWQKSPPVVSKAWSHQAWKSPEHMVGLRFFHCHIVMSDYHVMSQKSCCYGCYRCMMVTCYIMLHCLHKPEEKIRLNSFWQGLHLFAVATQAFSVLALHFRGNACAYIVIPKKAMHTSLLLPVMLCVTSLPQG